VSTEYKDFKRLDLRGMFRWKALRPDLSGWIGAMQNYMVFLNYKTY